MSNLIGGEVEVLTASTSAPLLEIRISGRMIAGYLVLTSKIHDYNIKNYYVVLLVTLLILNYLPN